MLLIQFFMFFHLVACILFSMVALLTAYFKDSYWPLLRLSHVCSELFIIVFVTVKAHELATLVQVSRPYTSGLKKV